MAGEYKRFGDGLNGRGERTSHFGEPTDAERAVAAAATGVPEQFPLNQPISGGAEVVAQPAQVPPVVVGAGELAVAHV